MHTSPDAQLATTPTLGAVTGAGLADRLAGVDGTLTVTSPTGGPTQVTATIPALAT